MGNLNYKIVVFITTVLQFLLSSFIFSSDSYDKTIIEEKVLALENILVEPKYTNVVEGYIKGYTIRRRESAERILGRQVLYFPVFEKLLKRNGLPESIKYLSVVESALVPNAVSHAEAVGLWQFVEETGKSYGLKIDKNIDERCDPVKSTVAAIRFLKDLHRKYQSWELALAAYNSGAGRVSRAIKRARSKDFWRIRRYLPRETRNYVPAYIAAVYLLKHYEDHQLTPRYPELDLQITSSLTIYNSFTFHELAQITDLPIEIIEGLNPTYVRGFIPDNPNGHTLTLPKRSIHLMEEFLESQIPDSDYQPLQSEPILVFRPSVNTEEYYYRTLYIAQIDQDINNLAEVLNCTSHQLKAWNNLQSNDIFAGQELILYLPKDVRPQKQYMEYIRIQPFEPIKPKIEIHPIAYTSRYESYEVTFLEEFGDPFLYYRLKKKQRLEKVAKQLISISLEELATLNNISPDAVLKAGTKLKIKKLY